MHPVPVSPSTVFPLVMHGEGKWQVPALWVESCMLLVCAFATLPLNDLCICSAFGVAKKPGPKNLIKKGLKVSGKCC